MKIQFKKFRDNVVIPTQGTELAGGWDVTAAHKVQYQENKVTYYLGFGLAIPEGYRLRISPRSSFTKTNWILQNSPALIDADYRGELQLVFTAIPTGVEKEYDSFTSDYDYKLTYDVLPYEVGDRIGQCYLEEVIHMDFVEVDSLNETKRGTGGFGHTGK